MTSGGSRNRVDHIPLKKKRVVAQGDTSGVGGMEYLTLSSGVHLQKEVASGVGACGSLSPFLQVSDGWV
jgi:hypothetical protein